VNATITQVRKIEKLIKMSFTVNLILYPFILSEKASNI
tara:strand:- start:1224 stop:1337 length:114 start_codon:yes stop_codon:yes gene_type:complete